MKHHTCVHCRNSSEKGEIALDLQAQGAKDALDMVKFYLKLLADIPSKCPDSKTLNACSFIFSC